MRTSKLFFTLFVIVLFGCSEVEDVKKIEMLENDVKDDVGNIIFVFDDGWDTQYTKGYKVLDEYGLKGNIAVVTDLIGKNNYITEDQLR